MAIVVCCVKLIVRRCLHCWGLHVDTSKCHNGNVRGVYESWVGLDLECTEATPTSVSAHREKSMSKKRGVIS